MELEYVGGSVDARGARSIQRTAGTALVTYALTDSLTPYFRFEILDPNTDVGRDSARLYIAGINFELDRGLHLKLEVDHTTSGSNNAAFAGDHFTEIKAAVAVGF